MNPLKRRAVFRLPLHDHAERPGDRLQARQVDVVGTPTRSRQRCEKRVVAFYRSVTPGYMRALGLELAAGRVLADTDHRAAPGAVVVNEEFARRLGGRSDAGVQRPPAPAAGGDRAGARDDAVIAQTVAQRMREIGIRLALGARRGEILRLVLGERLVLAGAGTAIGTAAAYVFAAALSRLLFGVRAHDPLVFTAVPALLLVVAAAVVWIPASRASTVDPAVALRMD